MVVCEGVVGELVRVCAVASDFKVSSYEAIIFLCDCSYQFIDLLVAFGWNAYYILYCFLMRLAMGSFLRDRNGQILWLEIHLMTVFGVASDSRAVMLHF